MLLVSLLYRSKILNGLRDTLLLTFRRQRWMQYKNFPNSSLYAISTGSSHELVCSWKNRILIILKLRKFYWSISVILVHIGLRRSFLSIFKRCMRTTNGRWIRKFSNTIELHGILIRRNGQRHFSHPLTLSLLKGTMESKVKVGCLNTSMWKNT